jgi:hypothetical protein
MLDFSPIGMRPISALIDLPLPGAVIVTGAETVYTLEVFSPVTHERILAAATREMITRPSDTLSNYPFHGTLNKALSFNRSVADGNAFNGVSSGYGEIELENSSGDYDGLEPLGGARSLVKSGQLGASFDTFQTLLDGLIESSHPEQDQVRISIRDNTGQLDVPLQTTFFAGTGGGQGDAALAQKPMPLAFGTPKNVTPTFVDPPNEVYQYGTGRSYAGPTEVRDLGEVIGLQPAGPTNFIDHAALIAGTVAAGYYITCIAESKIRLGAPASELTCDVYGAADSSGNLYRTTAQIVRHLMEERGFTIDAASFNALDALQDATVDYYIDSNSSPTVSQVLDDLLGGIDAFGGPRRDGVFDSGRIDVPSDDAISLTYLEIDIFDIEQLPLPSNIDPQPWRVRCPYQRNWTRQTNLAAGRSAAIAAFVATDYQLGTPASDDTILAANAKARDVEPKCFFAMETAAAAEANRLFALLSGVVRRMFRIQIAAPAFMHNIGQVIRIYHSRFELSVGLTVVIVGTRDDVSSSDEMIELTVIG